MTRAVVIGIVLTGLGAGMSSGCDATKATPGVGTPDAQAWIADGPPGSETPIVDTAIGGAMATGGMAHAGGATATGGAVGAGGTVGAGGATATGGLASTGGATGTGGSLATGGGLATGGASTVAGGAIATGGNHGTGGSVETPDAAEPLDSGRDAATVVRDLSSDTVRYPSEKYLAWQAPAGTTNLGPALVVTQGSSGEGTVVTWDRVGLFPPEMPVSSYAGSYTVSAAALTDLFARLANIDFSLLPHAASAVDCSPSLYFRQCKACAVIQLDYNRASQLVPEIESVWAWFDPVLGAAAVTNPRNYCNL